MHTNGDVVSAQLWCIFASNQNMASNIFCIFILIRWANACCVKGNANNSRNNSILGIIPIVIYLSGKRELLESTFCSQTMCCTLFINQVEMKKTRLPRVKIFGIEYGLHLQFIGIRSSWTTHIINDSVDSTLRMLLHSLRNGDEDEFHTENYRWVFEIESFADTTALDCSFNELECHFSNERWQCTLYTHGQSTCTWYDGKSVATSRCHITLIMRTWNSRTLLILEVNKGFVQWMHEWLSAGWYLPSRPVHTHRHRTSHTLNTGTLYAIACT